METQTTEMKRGEFLRSLGLSGVALMAFYCLGTASGCTNSSREDPQPGTVGGKVDVTLDLASSDFSSLNQEGGFAYSGNVLVARVPGGAFVALSKICTHQAGTVEYRLKESDFYCPVHGSRFQSDGSVINGPAVLPLKEYRTQLSGDKTSLRVYEA